jgi:hypothetical protein
MPTISTWSPVLTMPCSMRPVATGAAARDREDVLDRHQERLVQVALGLGDVRVQLLGELEDLALYSSSPSSALSAEP